MSEPPDPREFLAVFTADEVRAIAEGLAFAAALGEAGEAGEIGDLAGGIEWTPEKRRAFDDYVHAYLAWSRDDHPGTS